MPEIKISGLNPREIRILFQYSPSLVNLIRSLPGTKTLSGTDNLWEVRVLSRIGYIRILGFIEGHNLWLTHGIVKKTDKVPLTDIERADRYRKEYYSRRGLT